MAKKQIKLVGANNPKEPVSVSAVNAFLAANPTATISLTGGPSPLRKPDGNRFEIFALMVAWQDTALAFVHDKRVISRGGGAGDLAIGLNGSQRTKHTPFIELVA